MNVKLNSELDDENLKLQGSWQQIYCEEDGIANPPSDYGSDPILTIVDNTFGVTHRNGTILIKGLFAINPALVPKTIDWSDTFGTDAGKTFPAIYRFEQDRLIFCAADAGQERPKEFRAAQGQVLRIHRRVAAIQNR